MKERHGPNRHREVVLGRERPLSRVIGTSLVSTSQPAALAYLASVATEGSACPLPPDATRRFELPGSTVRRTL